MNILNIIRKLKENKSLLNGALFSLFSFINRGFTFLLLLILANYIAPAEYGYLSLFATIVMLVGYFIAMSTEGYMSVSYFRDGQKGVTNTVSSIFATTVGMTCVFFCILLLGGDKLSILLEMPLPLLFLSIAICFFTVFTNINLDYFRLQERVKIYGIFSCGNALFNFILSIILVKSLSYGWQGRVYAQTFCFAIFGIIGICYFIKLGHVHKPNWNYWKSMLVWGLPIIPHHATIFLRQGCDRYIINHFHSIDEVGLFSFALNLANIIIMIGTGFNQSNSVDIFKTLGSKDLDSEQKKEILNKQRRQIILIYLGATIAVVLGCCFFVPILLPKYVGSIKYFIVLSAFGFLQCVYFLYTNFLFFYKKTRNLMYITFGTSVIHLLLSLWLTRYSLYYTVSIYIVSQLIVVVLVRWQSQKLLVTEHIE